MRPLSWVSSLLRRWQLQPQTRRIATKRALLIGIRYGGELTRPHSDVDLAKDMLIDVFGYELPNITIMKDCKDVPAEFQPTQDNLQRVLSTFIDQDDAEYFLLYCGHSGQEDAGPDDWEEEDGKNEYILSMDNHRILDNDLHKWLLTAIASRQNSRLAALLDTCHSETLLDPPHYRCNRPSILRQSIRRMKEIVTPLFSAVQIGPHYPNVLRALATTNLNIHGAYGGITAVLQKPAPRCKYCFRDKSRPARVICISACKDREETYEDQEEEIPTLTMDVVELLRKDKTLGLKNLMKAIDSRCRQKLHYMARHSSIKANQHPQVASDVPLWYDSPFTYFLQA